MKKQIIDRIKKTGMILSMATFVCLAVPQISYAADSAYVNVSSANVRQKPVDGDNITSLVKGTYVQIFDTQQGADGKAWCKVQFSNQGKQIMGWIRKDLIAEAKDTETASENKKELKTETDATKQSQNSKETDAGSQNKKDSNTDVEGKEEEGDSTKDGTIVNGALSLKIEETFTADEIPVDFSKGEVTYKGKKYQGVTYDNGKINALYMVDKQTQIGSFYICDRKTEEIYPFVRIAYGDGYLIFLQNKDSSELPTGSSSAIIPLENGTQLQAFWYLGNAEATDFYEVYAMNEKGECAWYSYDNVDKTCQRLNIQDNSEKMNNLDLAYTKLKDKSEQQRKSDHKIMAGMLMACVLLFFTLINVLLKRPKKKKEVKQLNKENKKTEKKQPEKMSESENKAVADAVKSAVQMMQNDVENAKTNADELDDEARDHYMEVLEKVSQTVEKQPQAGFVAQAEEVLQETTSKVEAYTKNKSEEKKVQNDKKIVKNTNAKEAAARAEKVVLEQREDIQKKKEKDRGNGKDDLEIMDLNDL